MVVPANIRKNTDSRTTKQILEQVMISAGEYYLTDVPVVVEATIAESWAGKQMAKKSTSFTIYQQGKADMLRLLDDQRIPIQLETPLPKLGEVGSNDQEERN